MAATTIATIITIGVITKPNRPELLLIKIIEISRGRILSGTP